MTFLRRVSDSIYGANYRLETRRDLLIAEILCWIDRFFRATHLLRPEGLLFIGSRRDRPAPPISIVSDPAPVVLANGLAGANCKGFVYILELGKEQNESGCALSSARVSDSFSVTITVGSLGNIWIVMSQSSGKMAGTVLTQVDGVNYNVTDCNQSDAPHYSSGGIERRILVATGLSQGDHTVTVTNWPSASTPAAAFLWIGGIETS
jgi:hypothetical protein